MSDEIGKKLYDSGTPPAPSQKPTAPQPNAEADAAAALYGEKKPGEKKPEPGAVERKAGDDVADAVYDADPRSQYEPAMRESLDALADLGGATPEQRQQLALGAAEVFADARLSPQEASKLHALLLRQVRAGPADDATVDEWTSNREPRGASAMAQTRRSDWKRRRLSFVRGQNSPTSCGRPALDRIQT